MTDCEHPKCHEHLKLCLATKLPKKTAWLAMWALIVVIGIPLFSMGIQVWSGQENDHLRYVEKSEMIAHERESVQTRAAVKHMAKDMNDLKAGQQEVQRDVKEILKRLPNHGR